MKSTSLKNLNDVLLHLIGTTEIVLLDTGAGFGSDFRSTVTAARQVIVITNPELPAVADAMKAIDLAESYGAKVLGIVVNRVRNDTVDMTVKNISVLLGKPIIGVIPEDDHARVALSLKQPLVQSHPESPASIGFKQLAASLTGQQYTPSLSEKQEHSEKPDGHASFFTSLLKRVRGDEQVRANDGGDGHGAVSQATQG